MVGSLNPIVRKVFDGIYFEPKRRFTKPTEICLEDWWLSRPKNEEGIAVGGRLSEIRKCADAGTSLNLAPPMWRCPPREFDSKKVVKRHDSTTLEACDGILITLCGLINESRTQENGFSSEVCRDFICGFPLNWDDYTAQSTDEELKSNENFIENFTPDVFGSLNGGQWHDFFLSLTDRERYLIVDWADNNLALNPETELGLDIQCLKSSCPSSYSLTSGPSRSGPSRQRVLGISTANEDARACKKQRLDTSTDVYLRQVAECNEPPIPTNCARDMFTSNP